MQDKFYLSKNGEYVGPYRVSEIVQMVQDGQHFWTDYLYDEEKEEWIMMMEHPEFALKMNMDGVKRPKENSSPKIESKLVEKLKEKAWYILKDGNNYGPFSKIELVQMLQEKALFEFDYIWSEGIPAWKRVSEVEDFNAEAIRHLQASGFDDVKEVFFRRRHVRTQYGCSLIIHNNKTVFKGKSLELSAGGAGILIDHDSFNPGQQIYLHFQPGDGVPPFNAICEVVSKSKGDSVKGFANPTKYGVRFTTIPQAVRETIRTYATKAA